MGFAEAIKSGINNFFSPYGRASRSQFWWWYVFLLIIMCFFAIWSGFIFQRNVEDVSMGVIWDFISAIFAASMICAQIRRLHDIGKSGWNSLWGFIPIFGGIYLLIQFCKPSQPGPNRYGEEPA